MKKDILILSFILFIGFVWQAFTINNDIYSDKSILINAIEISYTNEIQSNYTSYSNSNTSSFYFVFPFALDCPNVFNLNANNFTSEGGVNISWSATPGAIGYDYEIQPYEIPQGSPSYIIPNTSTSIISQVINGPFVPFQKYTLYVRSNCTEGPGIYKSFNFTFSLPITNDDCSGAISISCGDVILGNTTTATPESIPGYPPYDQNARSVWYTFIGTNSENPSAAVGSVGDTVTLSTCNDNGVTLGSANYDTRLDIFSGNCGGLVTLGYNDDSTTCMYLSSLLTVSTVVGTLYYIRVQGSTSYDRGPFSLSMECAETCSPIAPNNSCSSAQTIYEGAQITGDNTCQPYFTYGNLCNQFTDETVALWYDFTTGPEIVGLGFTLTFGSSEFTAQDIRFGIYNNCLGNDSLFACSYYIESGIERAITNVTPNTNYKIAVSTSFFKRGTFGIKIVEYIAPDCPTDPSPAVNATGVEFVSGTTNVAVNWSAPSTGPTPTEYYVYIGTTPDVLNYSETITAPITSHTFNGLTTDTEYFWKIVPRNGAASNSDCQEWSFTVGTTLGIINNYLESISLYPNPVGNILNIDAPFTIVSYVEIIDISGRVVKRVNFEGSSNYNFDLSNLKSALYFIKIDTPNGSVTKRFIKE